MEFTQQQNQELKKMRIRWIVSTLLCVGVAAFGAVEVLKHSTHRVRILGIEFRLLGPRLPGSKDTPIVMEGGSIDLYSDAVWNPNGLTYTTTLDQNTYIDRIAVTYKYLHFGKASIQPAITSPPDTWKIDLVTTAGETETISGGGGSSYITVTVSDGSTVTPSDGGYSISISPRGGNTIKWAYLWLNNNKKATAECSTLKQGQCFVNFETHS